MIFYLLFTLIAIYFVVYKVLKNDIFAPACIVILSYVFAVLFACVNVNYWKIDLSVKTYLVIVGGVTFFALGNILVIYIYKNRLGNIKKKEVNLNEYKPIPIYVINILFIIIYDIIGIWLYYIEVKRIGGGGNFANMMLNYRMRVGYEGMYVSSVVNQIIRLITAFSVVSIYILMHNIILANQKIKQNALLIIPVILNVVKAVLTSGRYTFLQIPLEIIILYAFFYYKKNHSTLKIKPKVIAYGILSVIGMLFIFYAIRFLVGRNAEGNIVNYVTSYFGGPIELLDLYIKDYTGATSEMFGRITFSSLYKYLNKFLNISINNNGAQFGEFRRSVNGILIGNVYTSFRSYLQDFGYFSIPVLSFITSVLLSMFYYNSLMSKSDYPKIIYAYLSYGIFLHSYSEQFFSIYLSIDIWMIVFLIYLSLLFMTKVKLKI